VLVATALALLLAIIVYPKMVRSTRAANEASAIATMKEIGQAEMTYAATYPAIGFAESLGQLGGLDLRLSLFSHWSRYRCKDLVSFVLRAAAARRDRSTELL
jgi:hypothetical protein